MAVQTTSSGGSNISTPQSITGDTAFAPAPTGQDSGSSASASKDDKAGRSLPELGKDGLEEKTQKENGIRDRAAGLLNNLIAALGLTQEQADHAKNDVMAKGAGGVAVADVEVVKTVNNVTGADITKLDPRILAMASAERDVLVNSGAVMAQSHNIEFAGVAKPSQDTGIAHTA